MSNDELYQEALSAITRLFNDTSVPQPTCRENLNSLRDEIDILLDSIE